MSLSLPPRTQDPVSAQPSATSPCPSDAVGVLLSLSPITAMPGVDPVGLDHFPACLQTCLVSTELPRDHGSGSDPGYSHQTRSCPRLMDGLPSLTLDLPHHCEFAWKCSLGAETGCFLQACPAPLAGMLTGEVPGPGAVLLHSRPSSSGSSRRMVLRNICFPSLNLHSSFLIQTTSVLQFGLV